MYSNTQYFVLLGYKPRLAAAEGARLGMKMARRGGWCKSNRRIPTSGPGQMSILTPCWAYIVLVVLCGKGGAKSKTESAKRSDKTSKDYRARLLTLGVAWSAAAGRLKRPRLAPSRR